MPPACFAPFTSMYLDQRGNVLACCHSTVTPLGNVADAALDAIWWGPVADELRRRLAAHDLPDTCRFCRWHLDAGRPEAMYARNFDRFGPASAEGGWPVQIEFALSNRCNLQCIQCSGDFSSTIRSRRERRAPIASPYGEQFFAELAPFLARLEAARFLGGEPFLVPEYQRIWDALIEDGRPVACDVTTNGTVWSTRLEATLASLPFSIAVSLDGATRRTVEAVRAGADFDTVMANVERFSAYCERAGTPFALTYCLMTENWADFPAFLRLADDLGAEVFVNTVTWPPHLSLYQLPGDELRQVVDGLRDAPSHPALDREIERLGAHLDRPGDDHALWFEQWQPLPDRPAGEGTAVRPERADVLVTDGDHRVIGVEGDSFLGVPADLLLGASFGDALRAVADRTGHLLLASDEAAFADGSERFLLFEGAGGQTRVRTVAVTDGDRTTTYATVVDEFPG